MGTRGTRGGLRQLNRTVSGAHTNADDTPLEHSPDVNAAILNAAVEQNARQGFQPTPAETAERICQNAKARADTWLDDAKWILATMRCSGAHAGQLAALDDIALQCKRQGIGKSANGLKSQAAVAWLAEDFAVIGKITSDTILAKLTTLAKFKDGEFIRNWTSTTERKDIANGLYEIAHRVGAFEIATKGSMNKEALTYEEYPKKVTRYVARWTGNNLDLYGRNETEYKDIVRQKEEKAKEEVPADKLAEENAERFMNGSPSFVQASLFKCINKLSLDELSALCHVALNRVQELTEKENAEKAKAEAEKAKGEAQLAQA